MVLAEKPEGISLKELQLPKWQHDFIAHSHKDQHVHGQVLISSGPPVLSILQSCCLYTWDVCWEKQEIIYKKQEIIQEIKKLFIEDQLDMVAESCN